MNALDWFTLVSACVCLLLIVRRLVLMSWLKNNPMIIVLHGALAAACVAAAANAWEEVTGVIEVAAIVNTVAWLVVSFDDWRYGVPRRFSRPTELPQAKWHHVKGGRK